ncbi:MULTISPECIES: SDR family oxidoreductase [unclassified Streptomyces]|uniref:SDR family oxidoreductase n=1 Tax=unclassified Streptomyces TaxID=2593676 RepID=UPI002E760C50|nr:SDR family oxidoreductase [Streptomyces sp. JV176]MEE1802872.1 SDR family oxidoreductase [Streptomyces sp. JV176]
MRRRPPLRGRTVVITGAARGVGAQLARTLSARGARVALVGLEERELAYIATELVGETAYWHVDVTDADALLRTARSVEALFGTVDAVVANAGVATGGLFRHSDPEAWRRVVEVNLFGSVNTARAFLPALIRSRGYYLQIASLAALAPTPLMTAYCASKAAVEAFAHSLEAETAHHGVRTGVAYLSWTDTDMVRAPEQRAALGRLRADLPWPTGRTYPLAPAVDRIATGIERRARHVYAQPWLRAAQFLRATLPTLATRNARHAVAELESRPGAPVPAPAVAGPVV